MTRYHRSPDFVPPIEVVYGQHSLLSAGNQLMQQFFDVGTPRQTVICLPVLDLILSLLHGRSDVSRGPRKLVSSHIQYLQEVRVERRFYKTCLLIFLL